MVAVEVEGWVDIGSTLESGETLIYLHFGTVKLLHNRESRFTPMPYIVIVVPEVPTARGLIGIPHSCSLCFTYQYDQHIMLISLPVQRPIPRSGPQVAIQVLGNASSSLSEMYDLDKPTQVHPPYEAERPSW